MGDAAGELAERLHLLCLRELLVRSVKRFLRVTPFRDVARDLGEPDEFSRLIVDRIHDHVRPVQ